eukprot:COSAG01_NODE_14012_length_1507_cov_3.916903_3_plen_80_part_01
MCAVWGLCAEESTRCVVQLCSRAPPTPFKKPACEECSAVYMRPKHASAAFCVPCGLVASAAAVCRVVVARVSRLPPIRDP